MKQGAKTNATNHQVSLRIQKKTAVRAPGGQ
jgi:hypothetical protein